MNAEAMSLIATLLIREYSQIIHSEPSRANDERLNRFNEGISGLEVDE